MAAAITAEDLDLDDEPLDVLDLPQLYTRPNAASLLSTLQDLRSQPSSWSSIPVSGSRSISGTSTPYHKTRVVKSEGVPAYLTKIISSPLHWIETDEEKEEIWQAASQELSARSGRTAQGDITRSFTIPLSEDDLTIILFEPALTGDNVGYKTWASSYMLANRLQDLAIDLNKGAVLELGSGTGLLGMVAACVLGTHVLLTDLPEILHNLKHNLSANADTIQSHGGSTTAAVMGWSVPDMLATDQSMPANGFTLIIAADVVYSKEQPALVAKAVKYHLSTAKDARFVVELPIRQGFSAERQAFRGEMTSIGLAVDQEGEEVGFDDWATGDTQDEVRCWWSVWRWKD